MDDMQIEKNSVLSPDIIRPLVMRTLRRSNIQKKVAEYLLEISPSYSYTSEIAYNVKATPTNVIGAIRGMSTRYKNDESLINLNVVEAERGRNNIKLYRLTTFGKEVIESIHKRK